MPRRDKRADIVDAGIRVFSRKGFSHCSVEDILQEAHVARATFYSYFDSKKDLFTELVDRILNGMYEIIEREIGEMPASLEAQKERTKNALLGTYDFFSQNVEFAAIYFREVMGMNPEIDSRIADWQRRVSDLFKVVISRGIEAGVFRPVKDVGLVADFISGAPQQLALRLFLSGQPVDIPRIAEAIADIVIYGLAP